MTCEYHPRQGYFKHQLTETAMSDLFKIFTNFYLTEFDSSPVLSSHSYINVIEKIRPRKIYKIMPRGIKKIIEGLFDAELPLWYPVALKFEKSVL